MRKTLKSFYRSETTAALDAVAQGNFVVPSDNSMTNGKELCGDPIDDYC